MSKVITEKSFDQIKLIAKALQNEANINKKHGDSPDMNFEFDDMDLHDSTNDMITENSDATSLVDLMQNNADYMIALNLNLVSNDSGVFAYHADDDIAIDSSMWITTVLSLTKKLLKLGRDGIQRKVDYNKMLISEITQKQSALDNLSVDNNSYVKN